MNTLVNIQSMRGMAALWVFLHHSLGHFYAMNLSFKPFEWLAAYGFAGVDVFFVISGLVMAKTTEAKTPGWHTSQVFLIKRLFRIFLGYWPLFFMAWAANAYFWPERLAQVDLLTSFLLWLPDGKELLITPAWSLTYELLFYVMLGVLLLFKPLRATQFFALLVVLIIVKVNWLEYGQKPWLDLLLSPFIFEFLVGFYLWKYRAHMRSNSWLLVFILLAVAGLAAGVYFETVNSTWRVFTFGGFALGIIGLAWLLEDMYGYQMSRLTQKLGDASYTVYLFHTIALMAFWGSGVRQWLTDTGWSAPGFVLMLLLTLLFSYFLYRIIEKPLYRWATSRLHQPPVKAG